MIFDMHVHFARFAQKPGTQSQLHPQRSPAISVMLRRLGYDKAAMNAPDIDDHVRLRLLEWFRASSVDRFVMLALDGVYDHDGAPRPELASIIVDNDDVMDFIRSDPALLLGASIHPYRKDALCELERVIHAGACLVKWIPSSQRIRVDDDICRPFYEMLAATGTPLLVHTGVEHTCSFWRNSWNDPALLTLPLKMGVKVIAAHCGARLFLHDKCYFKTFCRMAREYEHFYGDISAFGLPTRIGHLKKLLASSELTAKILYGSDFPAFPLVHTFAFHIGLKNVSRLAAIKNRIEQPYQLMRKMGVPEQVFSRAENILRLPALCRSSS